MLPVNVFKVHYKLPARSVLSWIGLAAGSHLGFAHKPALLLPKELITAFDRDFTVYCAVCSTRGQAGSTRTERIRTLSSLAIASHT